MPEQILGALDLPPVRDVQAITSGWSGTSIWRVDTGMGAYALRVFGREQLPLRDWERDIMNAAAGHDVPLPAIRASGETDGYPWLLTDWLSGQRLIDAALRRPWNVMRLGEAFGEMQARLHDIRADLEQPPDAWIDWPAPSPGPIAERLHSLPLQRGRIIHLDYHPENALAEGTAISGVLDWSNAHTGDPRADLARSFVILEGLPLVFGVRRRLIRPLVRRFLHAWWRGYAGWAGSQAEMPLFCAWAYRGLIADLTPKLDMPQLNLDRDALRRQLDALDLRAAAWERRAGIVH